MNKLKLGILGSMVLVSLSLIGCAPSDELAPHDLIEDKIDFNQSPEEIQKYYTKEGQDWIRMLFPDENQRSFALKNIGRHAPDVSFLSLNNEEQSLQEVSGDTILYFTKIDSDITTEMDEHMQAFKKENEGITVYHIYANNEPEDITDYLTNQDFKIDDADIISKNGATELVDAFNIEDIPLLVYIDDTHTVSYTATGFRDLVFLNDHAEAAFGDEPFYEFIDITFNDNNEERTES